MTSPASRWWIAIWRRRPALKFTVLGQMAQVVGRTWDCWGLEGNEAYRDCRDLKMVVLFSKAMIILMLKYG